jgi:hypothetical protein
MSSRRRSLGAVTIRQTNRTRNTRMKRKEQSQRKSKRRKYSRPTNTNKVRAIIGRTERKKETGKNDCL